MIVILLLPAVLLFLVFTVWPIVKVIQLSLYQTNFIRVSFVGLQNYIQSFQNEDFLQAIINSIFYVIFMVLGHVGLSLLVSMAMFKLSKKWQDISRIAVYIPVLSAGIIIAQIWKFVFHPNGPVNWVLSLMGKDPINWFGQGITAIPIVCLVVVISSFGSNVIILFSSLLSIDKSIIESARIDGASDRKIKWCILIPIIRPTILMVILLVSINALQIFETIYVLAPQSFSATLTFHIYRTGFQFSKYGMASAQAVILLAITLILSIIKKKVEPK